MFNEWNHSQTYFTVTNKFILMVNSKVKYTRDMWKTMSKAFFTARDKGLDVDTCAEVAASKLIKKFGDRFDSVSPAGVRSKCYELKRRGYDYKSDTLIGATTTTKKETTPAKTAKTVEVMDYDAGNVKQVSFKVGDVEITMVFK